MNRFRISAPKAKTAPPPAQTTFSPTPPRKGTRRTDRRVLFVAIVSLLATALLACSTPTEPAVTGTAPSATPPFFEIDGGPGAKLALIGTIHLGPDGGWSFPQEVEATINRANLFVMELDLREATEEASSQGVVKYGLLPGDTPLSTIVSPETARLLEQHDASISAMGLPRLAREALQPWLIAIMLTEMVAQQADYSGAGSVEQQLLSRLGDRPLHGLETLDHQLSLFGDLPFDLQELLLQDTLDGWESADRRLADLIEAWRINDQASLVAQAREGIQDRPRLAGFYDILLDNRNRKWIPSLIELLEDPGQAGSTVLVAVGGLHLVGPTGVPNLLRRAGYRVQTITQPYSANSERP